MEVDPAMAVTCRQLEPRHQPRPKSSASKSAAVSSANPRAAPVASPPGSRRRCTAPGPSVRNLVHIEPQAPLSSYMGNPAP
jgi:hypothetical protein